MLYYCETCGAEMDFRPVREVFNRQPDGFWETGFSETCPYCESPHVRPYNSLQLERVIKTKNFLEISRNCTLEEA